ncbi:lysylphosphatidylglycerol synthase transmembrane domain-containing protein [Belliella kenyensis]|uniref:Lysylphosphatidylglycerol synthase transmembrane domain-containing protein n=1 Tax=Belliella kenyensis TaxID=1472724 RepID=A0ABV8ELZ1_9BACT|nr:lysylphosphatidylglycerol synthase transmembrane domain-containing protein [Belliella kenyensis]MCH7403320.1 flippase-like domain-containing protein [Belliella kenyensis]MDN3602961.1 lysylphosphatidylglycerol synthase transmembrane domain-containing protein [Belliella kenyensis]
MKITLKQGIQVVVSLIVAVGIFWFLYKDISFEELSGAVAELSWYWLAASILVALFGFWLRAWRWKLLIDASTESNVRTSRAFWALMVGYLTNLIVPRAGEVARCGVLKKTDGLDMGKLVGTVIVERSIDLLMMVSCIFLAFVIERELFVSIFEELVATDDLSESLMNILPIGIGVVIFLSLVVFFIFKKFKESRIVIKVRNFGKNLYKGMLSIKDVENQLGFWMSSLGVWLSYYLTMYAVALGIPSTASLTASAILMVMVMGSIGMTAPVQGGIGTFHALVAFILMKYDLSEEQGKIFAAIIHGSQVLTIIAIGLLALGIFLRISAKKKPRTS